VVGIRLLSKRLLNPLIHVADTGQTGQKQSSIVSPSRSSQLGFPANYLSLCILIRRKWTRLGPNDWLNSTHGPQSHFGMVRYWYFLHHQVGQAPSVRTEQMSQKISTILLLGSDGFGLSYWNEDIDNPVNKSADLFRNDGPSGRKTLNTLTDTDR
jgi:hypothetical protein